MPPEGHLEPEGQAVKRAAPAAPQKVLEGHARHLEAKVWPTSGWYVPAGHAIDAVALAGQYHPGGHTATAAA
jgi:hypothetical protein